jgi:hypothetical protein
VYGATLFHFPRASRAKLEVVTLGAATQQLQAGSLGAEEDVAMKGRVDIVVFRPDTGDTLTELISIYADIDLHAEPIDCDADGNAIPVARCPR